MEFRTTRINAVAVLLAALMGCGGGGESNGLALAPAQGGGTPPSPQPAELPAPSPAVPEDLPPGGSGARIEFRPTRSHMQTCYRSSFGPTASTATVVVRA